MSMPKFRVLKTQQVKGYTSSASSIGCNVKVPHKPLGEFMASVISRVLKANKFTKEYNSHITMRDGESTFFLGDKEDNKFLSTDSLAKKSIEKIANDVCNYLNDLKVSYEELKLANIWTISAEGTKFVVSIEQVENKSESNKSSTTRAGKILESLNKRTRQLSEGKAVFKIVMPADSHNPQRAEYYDSNEGMEFAQDIKNLMKGAGAYKKKGDDWVFVKGTDVLGLKSKGTSAVPKKKSILKRLFRR